MEFNVTNLEKKINYCRMDGSAVLAEFDLNFSGLAINGCGLICRTDGQVIVLPPHGKNAKARPVRFRDFALRNAIRDRALAIYEGTKRVDAAEADSLAMAGL